MEICFAFKIQGVRKWFFWFWFFIIQSYFKLRLQNSYQLKDQLKKLYEQQLVVNKVEYERQEWVQRHQTDIQPPATRSGEFHDQCLHKPLWSVSSDRAVLSAVGAEVDVVLHKNPQKEIHRCQIRRSRRAFHRASTPDPTIMKTSIHVTNTSLHYGSAVGYRLVDKSSLKCPPAAAALTIHITCPGRWSLSLLIR
jgi:hypothetical protein